MWSLNGVPDTSTQIIYTEKGRSYLNINIWLPVESENLSGNVLSQTLGRISLTWHVHSALLGQVSSRKCPTSFLQPAHGFRLPRKHTFHSEKSHSVLLSGRPVPPIFWLFFRLSKPWVWSELRLDALRSWQVG